MLEPKKLALVVNLAVAYLLASFLLGYLVGWGRPFYTLLTIFGGIQLYISIDAFQRNHDNYKRLFYLFCTMLGFILGICTQVMYLDRYIQQLYVDEGPFDGTNSGSFPPVSVVQLGYYERIILQKVESARNGDDTFLGAHEERGYSFGPDGINDYGLIVYDPTNGVISRGDVHLKF